jgi:hypothetical protein
MTVDFYILRLLFESTIQSIKQGAFHGLTNLSYLYLQRNNLTTLPEGVFSHFDTRLLKLLALTCSFNVVPAIKPSLSPLTLCLSPSQGINITAWNDEMRNVLAESAHQCASRGERGTYSCSPCPVGSVGIDFGDRQHYRGGQPVCHRCPAGKRHIPHLKIKILS